MPKLFVAFAIDYKFINGRLIVFELGNALQSNQKRTRTLYGISQFTAVIREARSIAKRRNLELYRDFSIPSKRRKREHYELLICTPAFYDRHRKGVIVSHRGDDVGRMGIYERDDLIIGNARVQATLKLKWLLYHHCKKIPELSAYIPKTYHATKATLAWVTKKLVEGEYYVKHSDGAFAIGTQRLQKEIITWKRIAANADFRNGGALSTNPSHHTFIIQELIQGDLFLRNGGRRTDERTRRVFVIVAGDASEWRHLKIKLLLPYFSIPKDSDCDSPDKRSFFKLDMGRDEQAAIRDFTRKLLASLYDKKQRRFPKHWEAMVADFVKKGSAPVHSKERLLRLALIGQALMQENYCSFDKINASSVRRLNSFVRGLSAREKRIIDFNMQRFLTYTLIGHPEWPMPAGYVNKGLMKVFKAHLPGLKPSQIAFYRSHIEDRLQAASSPSHPLHHNLAVLKALWKFLTKIPRYRH